MHQGNVLKEPLWHKALKNFAQMFECRIRSNKFPEEGEVVIGKILSVSSDVVSMQLLEYGKLEGLILTSELSKRRFKTISQLTKVGSIEICQVLKVEEAKGFVDLSLKRVSDQERHECKDSFSRNKLAYQIMVKAAKLAECTVTELYENWGYAKANELGSLFAYFSSAKDDLSILDSEPRGEFFKRVIEDQFKASSFKVRADVDVTCAIGGIIAIKDAFNKVLELDNGLEIALLRSPTFSIVKVSEDRQEAFHSINMAVGLLKEEIESRGGTFSIVSTARVYGEKSRHTVLDGAKQNIENDLDTSEDSDESE